MVRSKRDTDQKEDLRRKVKVDKLRLSKETVRDLTVTEQKNVGGGRAGTEPTTTLCKTYICTFG